MQNFFTFCETHANMLEILAKEKSLHTILDEFLSGNKGNIIADESREIRWVKRHKIDG